MPDSLVVRGCILRHRFALYGSECLSVEVILPYTPVVIKAVDRLAQTGEIEVEVATQPRYQQLSLAISPGTEGPGLVTTRHRLAVCWDLLMRCAGALDGTGGEPYEEERVLLLEEIQQFRNRVVGEERS